MHNCARMHNIRETQAVSAQAAGSKSMPEHLSAPAKQLLTLLSAGALYVDEAADRLRLPAQDDPARFYRAGAIRFGAAGIWQALYIVIRNNRELPVLVSGAYRVAPSGHNQFCHTPCLRILYIFIF